MSIPAPAGGVEGCGELAGAVADEEVEAGGVVVEVHQQVAGLCNAAKLGTDREDVDLRWIGVELDSVGFSFDAVAVRPVSLDHPGTCSLSPWAEAFLGDLVDGFGECVGESVRGKSPPG